MHDIAKIVATAAICTTLALTSIARAAGVALADLQAATRSLGFLQTIQSRPTISIGVVYSAGVRDGKNSAAQAADALAMMHGPGSPGFSTIRASIVAIDELAQNATHFDVLYVMPGVGANGARVADAVRRKHIVSISSDPACLDANYCVLMVRAGSASDIVIDTALADAAGIQFPSLFTMLVKHK